MGQEFSAMTLVMEAVPTEFHEEQCFGMLPNICQDTILMNWRNLSRSTEKGSACGAGSGICATAGAVGSCVGGLDVNIGAVSHLKNVNENQIGDGFNDIKDVLQECLDSKEAAKF